MGSARIAIRAVVVRLAFRSLRKVVSAATKSVGSPPQVESMLCQPLSANRAPMPKMHKKEDITLWTAFNVGEGCHTRSNLGEIVPGLRFFVEQ